jgi:hypothetical protein
MDDVSKAKAQLHHTRDIAQTRAAEFWQGVIIAGRMQQQTDQQQQRPEQKPSQPRQ